MNEKVAEALSHWPYVAPLLQRPKTETDYLALAETLEAVLEAGGADESHPLASLADTLGGLIEEYEAEHHPVEVMLSPAEMLRGFMEQHGLKESDLPEVGDEGEVNEILTGITELKPSQIKALAVRFQVGVAVFS